MVNLITRLMLRLPAFLLRRMAGAPALQKDGKTLNAACQLLCAQAGPNPLGAVKDKPQEIRDRMKNAPVDLGAKPYRPVQRDTSELKTRDGASIRIREYRPSNWQEGGTDMLYIHGGGWVLCDLESHDAFCACLAAGLGVRVFSTEYRLAPENPFPTPLDDCEDSWNWLCKEKGCKPENTAIGGDSAGGNLATALCMKLRDSKAGLPCLQLLIYPGVDAEMSSKSCKEYGENLYLTADSMRWFWGSYLPDKESQKNPLGSPILGDLQGLPPAHVIIAGFDPLQDEGRLYAEKLQKASVSCTLSEYPELIHGFINVMAIPAAAHAVGDFLRTTKTLLRD